jgi:hypothetical protein
MSVVREGRKRRSWPAHGVTRAAVAAIVGVALAASSPAVVASQRKSVVTPEIVESLASLINAPSEELAWNDPALELLLGIDSIADADQDDVPDAQDCEPQSILTPTIVLGGRDTGVPNMLFTTGCTTADLIASVTRVAKNHGQFVSGVAHLTKSLITFGVLDEGQKGDIMSAAARSK